MLEWIFGKREAGPKQFKTIGTGRDPQFKKSERQIQRERLYRVIRNVMLNAGIMKPKYRFKVLSTNGNGTSYIVMMDLDCIHAVESPNLKAIETKITILAREILSIEVKSMYWRVGTYLQEDQASPHEFTGMPEMSRRQVVTRQLETVTHAEIDAFRKALDVGAGTIDVSAVEEPSSGNDFLGKTQYGQLN